VQKKFVNMTSKTQNLDATCVSSITDERKEKDVPSLVTPRKE